MLLGYWEISILLHWDSFMHQRRVTTIFLFTLALKYHGNCHKYLCQTNTGAPKYSLLLSQSQRHKGRWRFVTVVQLKFTPLCPGPQTSTTARAAELGKKPALSSGSLVLHSPTCENLSCTAHCKWYSPHPPYFTYICSHFCTHSYVPLHQLQSQSHFYLSTIKCLSAFKVLLSLECMENALISTEFTAKLI